MHGGSCLVHDVDGLVGLVPRGDVAVGEGDAGADGLRGIRHVVELLVMRLEFLEYPEGHGVGGRVHGHFLEPAGEGSVFLDDLTVFVGCGGAYALESAPGQCRLDDGGGVHCASSSAGSHYVVYLVYEEDSVGVGLYRVQDLAQPFLEVSTELGAGHHRGQVDGDDLLVHQVEGDIPVGYPPCNAFGQGCLADSGVSDYHGVVLLPPAENLYDPVYLPVPSGHRV